MKTGSEHWGCSAWRSLKGDPGATFHDLVGAYKRAREGLFKKPCTDMTKSNGLKLKECRFRLDIRKNPSAMGMVRH